MANPDLSSLKMGDLIEISRILYQHWAVYIGDGEVVHLTGDRKPFLASSSSYKTDGRSFNKAMVQREKVTDVLGKDKWKVHRISSKFSPEKIRERALSKVGEVGYHILYNNCEHFVNWCRFNVPFSLQTMKPSFPETYPMK